MASYQNYSTKNVHVINFLEFRKQKYLGEPFKSNFNWFVKNSFSFSETEAQSEQWRTGSTKHMRGNGTKSPQQSSQKQFPHRRQWC